MKKIFFLIVVLCILNAGMPFFCSNTSAKAFAGLQEELTNSSLALEGSIPGWLSGTLIRNGPIDVTINGQTQAHWFDGLAMLHAFSFGNGQVSYTNKFLRTNAYDQVFKKGSLHYDGFAEDPCRSLFKRFFTWFVPKSHPYLHNANVNVAKLADQYVALTETPLPVSFDPQTLATLGVLEYQDKLPREKCWESAHPHYDLEAKRTLNYLIQYGRTSYYTLYSLADGSSQREVISRVPVQKPSYMHSFAVTENYIIFTEFPFVVKPLDLLLKGEAFIKNFSWEPERGTQFLVVDRKNGQVVGKYKTHPFFAFHHANAFEANGNIYLDIVVYDDARIISDIATHFRQTDEKQKSPVEPVQFASHLDRFVLSLQKGELSAQTLVQGTVEFPRINGNFDGKPYTYLYLIDARGPVSSEDMRSIYKVNTQTREMVQWSAKGCYPGEPIFVGAPHAENEDDGVILSLVLDLFRHSSFLLVLDATTFQEIGRAQVTHAIPAGLHGQYFQAPKATAFHAI
jgi:beta,beta-carotene 9',10'-dioxygenase